MRPVRQDVTNGLFRALGGRRAVVMVASARGEGSADGVPRGANASSDRLDRLALRMMVADLDAITHVALPAQAERLGTHVARKVARRSRHSERVDAYRYIDSHFPQVIAQHISLLLCGFGVEENLKAAT